MSLEQPMTVADIREKQKQKRIARVRRFSAWSVSPDGDVAHHICEPEPGGKESQQGYTVFRWIDGRARLRGELADQGYTDFADECKASGQPELVEQMREIAVAQAEGLPIRLAKDKTGKPDMSTIYPRTVLEKRALGGLNSIAKGKAYVPGEGVVADPEIKAKLDSKLESLGLKPPEDDKPARGRRKAATDGT